MTYSFTIFNPPRWWDEKQRFVYDNKTHRRMDFDDWDGFANFMAKLSQLPIENKTDAYLISPAIFEPGSPRRNANVIEWAGWAAIDIDDWDVEGDIEDAINDVFGAHRFVAYSTASSRKEQRKFRLALPLSRPVARSDIRHFWFALQSEFNDLGDKQCKDLSRMYYIPAKYHGSDWFFIDHRDGRDVDVDYLLAKYPYEERAGRNFLDRLPAEWMRQVIQHRQDQLDNTSYVWSDYTDCPFVDQRQITEYKSIAGIDGTGRYRMIYKIMVVIAMNAVRKKYPLTVDQLVTLIKQLDADTANRYQGRPLEVEANNALEYAYRNTMVG